MESNGIPDSFGLESNGIPFLVDAFLRFACRSDMTNAGAARQ